VFKTVQQCKKLYRDIGLGYCYASYNKAYIKHLTEGDFGTLEDKSQEFIDYAHSKGIGSEKEILIALHENGSWLNSEEELYQFSIQEVRDLIDQRRTLYLKEQVEQIGVFIKEKERALDNLHVKRSELLSITSESYASRKQQEEVIKISFYKDPEFKTLLYNDEVFDELDIPEIRKVFLLYTSLMLPYCDKNLQKVSVCPFFLNLFSLCEEDVSAFYGKPICNLSVYQSKLLEFSKINTVIIKEEGKGRPDDYYQDLDKVINWFDTRYQILVGKSAEARQKNNSIGR